VIEKNPVNKFTSTITLQSRNGEIKGLKKYYQGIEDMGKHFLVKSLTNKNVKRHYTISNCMEKNAY
jgi:hypothetical protein